MWQIKNPAIKTATLDFSSSGQNSFPCSQLFAEDAMLVNAIELVDWQEEKTQFLICESCGIVHCNSGGWVSLRVAGDLILLLPAFASWLEDGKTDDEYQPPYYLFQRGVAYFTRTDYEALRLLNSAFPAVEELRRMSMQEAVLAFQMDAPSRIFGNPPDKLVARRDAVLGASEGNEDEHLKFIEEFAQRQKDSQSAVKLRLPKATETVISLFLDTHEFIEWKVLASSDSEFLLMLNSEFVISLAA
jgi:hypothetical protein